MVDHIAEGVDLVFRIGTLKDSSLVARRLLTYRHRLLASPAYLANNKPPKTPQDLRKHRLLAFSRWRPENRWNFVHTRGSEKESFTFQPHISMNDYAGLAHALLSGSGIGELPPLVRPDLLREGLLVEVMPRWRFQPFDLSLIHLGNRHISRPLRVFKEFAAQHTSLLFPRLPR